MNRTGFWPGRIARGYNRQERTLVGVESWTGVGRMRVATVTVEVPDNAFSALRLSPREFAQKMRVAAAI
jgi:hypothetical protein